MTDQELVTLIHDTAEEVMEQEFEPMSPESEIAGMGIDSLGLAEIVEIAEEKLDVSLPEEELTGVSTLEDLISLFRRQMSG